MKDLIEPMEFFKIDKISDDVYAIGPNIILKFNVSLSKISDGTRYHYHREYEYPAKGLKDTTSLVSIKRSFDYYLSIENIQKDSNGNKLFIRIGLSEQVLLKKGLEIATSWFTSESFNKLFALDKGKIVMLPPIPEYTISNLPMNRVIHITPTIIDRGIANADKEPGVFIRFDENTSVSINLERLFGFYNAISSMNLYQSAIELINYIQRPEFGTNRFLIDLKRQIPEKDNRITGATGIEGRFVTPKGKNSIDSLEN